MPCAWSYVDPDGYRDALKKDQVRQLLHTTVSTAPILFFRHFSTNYFCDSFCLEPGQVGRTTSQATPMSGIRYSQFCNFCPLLKLIIPGLQSCCRKHSSTRSRFEKVSNIKFGCVKILIPIQSNLISKKRGHKIKYGKRTFDYFGSEMMVNAIRA